MTASTGHGASAVTDIETMKAALRPSSLFKLHVSGWKKMGMCDLPYQ